MASNDKKNKLEWFDTYIGESVQIDGRFVARKSIRIDGAINGNIEPIDKNEKTTVAIGDLGVVRGDIKSYRVIVSGKVFGNIYADEQVSLSSTAKVDGNITYRSISVEEGAVVTGSVILKDGDKTIVDTAIEFFKKYNLGSKT